MPGAQQRNPGKATRLELGELRPIKVAFAFDKSLLTHLSLGARFWPQPQRERRGDGVGARRVKREERVKAS